MMLLQELIVPLLMDTSDFDEKVEKAEKKASGLDSTLGGLAKVGGGVLAGGFAIAGAGVTALTAGMVSSVESANDWAGTLDSVADVLGTTSEESAGLALLMKSLGGDSDTLTNSLAIMSKGLLNTNGELGPTGLALQNLGINFQNADGSFKSAPMLFQEIADKLNTMPDGLEKTSLMMDLFGKSGKEMGDYLGAAANGGIASYIQQATDMGLALSQEQVDNTINMGIAQEKFNATLQGLQTTLGTAIIPLITQFFTKVTEWVSDPIVQDTIQVIADKVAAFGQTALDYLPQIIDAFIVVKDKIVDFGKWLMDNEGILVGIFAALGIAIAVFVYTTVLPALAAVIVPMLPIIAVLGLIVAAVALVYEAWVNDFGGIQTFFTKLWDEKLKPVFDVLKTWLEKNIPLALKTLTDFWNEKLLPAIKAVWDFLSKYVFPLFQAIGAFIGAVFSKVFEALAGVFTNVLLPVLSTVWDFLSTYIFPIFQSIGNWIADKLSPAFDGLGQILQNVTNFFLNLASGISNLQLPDWLTPGSPTPLEIAMVGLNKQLKQAAVDILPKFSNEISMNKTFLPINNNNAVVDAIRNIPQSEFDYSKFGRTVRDAVLQATG